MPIKKQKTSLKSALFWDHFEKSGSIQAYLRFHAARQEKPVRPVARKKGKAKTR